ncbi:MAG: hypothetical protein WA294_16545 [Acidobacteriaceae bacterium]
MQTPAESLAPAAAVAQPQTAVAVAELVEDVPATVPAPQATVAGAPDLDRIREAVCAALGSEGHETAAAQVMSGEWTQQGNGIQVGLPMRKAMLALTINAEAEAICRKAMKAIGATQKIAFVPGENSAASGTAAKASVPIAGSAQSAALENPLVRRTQELFKAEIRSVLDLREPQ